MQGGHPESDNPAPKAEPVVLPSSEASPSAPKTTPQPFRHRANAPISPYPPPSNHEYAPRTVAPPTGPTGPATTNSSPASSPVPRILPLPALATLRGRPTIPPRPPNKNDERCIIYCTQTASRRSVGQQPICKTFCWRRLFPQDSVPIPSEDGSGAVVAPKSISQDANNGGKKGNTIRMPDGKIVVERKTFETKPGIFGFDGRFVYFGRSRFRARDRLDTMSHPGLSEDWTVDELLKENDPNREDKAYMDFLRRYHYSTQIEVAPLPNQLLATISDKFYSLLVPATKYVESFAPGGAQEKFALKVWEKAREGEGWALFRDASKKLWEDAKRMEAEERSKKDGNGKSGRDGTAPSS